MADVERMLFAVGVFKDIVWAEKGIDALAGQGFLAAELSVIAKDSPEATAFIERVLGACPEATVLPKIGPVLARGTLVEALQGTRRDLDHVGVAGAMRRVGFQPHDGLIYETLVERGGILVAAQGAPRVADALAVLHSYGGGNAAIGAWGERV